MSKIYELAEQSAEYAVLNPSEEVLQSETEDAKVEIPKAFIDQFAKLIVRECSAYVEGTGNWLVAMEMKQHFGVENA